MSKARANPYRWTNKLPGGGYRSKGGRKKSGWEPFRKERCPTCNRRYRYFRAEHNREAFEIIKRERDDPSHRRTQVNINQLLGKMRELKLEAWEAHKEECELVARQLAGERIDSRELEEVLSATALAPGYFVRWDEKTVDAMYPQATEKRKPNEGIPF